MRIKAAGVVVAVALAATALGAGTADAAGPLSGTKIRDWQTASVLGVVGNSTAAGAQLQYQTDSDSLAQKWAVEPVTNTTFMLHNLNSDMCATAVNTVSDVFQQRPCDPRWDEQIFSLEDSVKPNRFQLKNQGTNQCLNPSTSATVVTARGAACAPNNNYYAHSFEVS